MISKKLFFALAIASSAANATTSGSFVVNNSSTVLTVPDSSCSAVMKAADDHHGSRGSIHIYKSHACSSNPIVAGSTVSFRNSSGTPTGSWTITSITAKPPAPVVQPTSPTTQTVQLVFEPIMNMQTFFKNFGIGFSLVLFFVTLGISVGTFVNFVKRL